MLNTIAVFNIDNNNKCFLSCKSVYILKDHVTWKTGVMAVLPPQESDFREFVLVNLYNIYSIVY